MFCLLLELEVNTPIIRDFSFAHIYSPSRNKGRNNKWMSFVVQQESPSKETITWFPLRGIPTKYNFAESQYFSNESQPLSRNHAILVIIIIISPCGSFTDSPVHWNTTQQIFKNIRQTSTSTLRVLETSSLRYLWTKWRRKNSKTPNAYSQKMNC